VVVKETNSSDPLKSHRLMLLNTGNILQARGLEPNTVNTALSSIYAICSWMVKEGYLGYNPVAEVERVGIVATAPRG